MDVGDTFVPDYDPLKHPRIIITPKSPLDGKVVVAKLTEHDPLKRKRCYNNKGDCVVIDPEEHPDHCIHKGDYTPVYP